jgi:hypothetical protein
VRLSHPPRMLPGMRWWQWALAGWVPAAGAVAVVVGRSIRLADRRRYLPQLDVPLWRGTDLPDPPPCPGCAHGECLRACPPGTCGAIDDDEAARAALEPVDDPAGLAGAVLGIAFATDETTARHWLSVAARRGATWEQQRDLWDTWQRQQDANVTYLHTDREDPRP